ncbi:Zinc finger BED domain-containing protein 1, partial [Stegodyphus mimosarum]
MCDISKDLLSIKGGSTGNLKKHLQRKHPCVNLHEKRALSNQDVDDIDASPASSVVTSPADGGQPCKSQQTTQLTVDNSACDIVGVFSQKSQSSIMQEDIAQAAFLEPRIKKLGLKCDVAKKIADFADIICELSVVAQTIHNLVEDVEGDDEEIDESSVWFEFESKVKGSRTSSAPAADAAIEKAAAEVKKYLQEPILSRKSDPLEWWEKNENVFPNLYELSRKKLGLVATSVPCERVFSKAGLILNDRRNRLSGQKLKQLIFLHYNYNI